MSKFAKNVYAAFQDLSETYLFIAARAYASRDFASLFSKASDGVYFYLFVHDGRPHNAAMSVSCWIAPAHEPSDGLDNLCVGYKVAIASSYEVDDEFFGSCQRRILLLLPHLHHLSGAVLHELASPSFRTTRYLAYRMERAALDCAIQSKSAGPAVEAFANIAKSTKASYEALERAALPIARILIDERGLPSDVSEFYGRDVEFLSRSLLGHLYVHVLSP